MNIQQLKNDYDNFINTCDHYPTFDDIWRWIKEKVCDLCKCFLDEQTAKECVASKAKQTDTPLAPKNPFIEDITECYQIVDVKNPPKESGEYLVLMEGKQELQIFFNEGENLWFWMDEEGKPNALYPTHWLKKIKLSAPAVGGITYNHFLAVIELMKKEDFPKNYYMPEAKEKWLKDVKNYFENNHVELNSNNHH